MPALLPPPLLAESEFLSHLSRHMRGEETPIQWEAMLFGAAVAFAVWGALRWWSRRRLRDNDPAALFLELCAAHRLGRGQRRLLRELAEARGVAPLGRLFLEPELYDPQPLGEFGRRRGAQLGKLQARLFGAEPAEEAPAEQAVCK